jgi:high-affinity K+ transport system ATPase subunit B
MTEGDLIGWMAAALTLLTFSMRSMFWLRLVALTANACFIGYGVLESLFPVIALHVLLIPCNLWRLVECLSDDRTDRVGGANR